MCTGSGAQAKAALDAASQAASDLGATASKAASGLKEAASGVLDTLNQSTSGALDGLNQATSGALEGATSALKDISESVSGAGAAVQGGGPACSVHVKFLTVPALYEVKVHLWADHA